MQEIHWYPGHMAKAKRQLLEMIKYLDLIIEVRDARIPLASHNIDLETLIARKPSIIILNKTDLAKQELTEAWLNWFKGQAVPVIAVNGKNGQGVQNIWKTIPLYLPISSTSNKRPFRLGVIGIPNVGKSTVLNRILGTGAAKTGNLPGVTRGKQWIKRDGFEIMDTPGLLPPKITNQADGMKLALLGTIREEIVPAYDLALYLMEQYGDELFGWDLSQPGLETGEARIAWYAKKRSFLIKGGEIDINRAISALLKEFRDGKLGRITLENPSDH